MSRGDAVPPKPDPNSTPAATPTQLGICGSWIGRKYNNYAPNTCTIRNCITDYNGIGTFAPSGSQSGNGSYIGFIMADGPAYGNGKWMVVKADGTAYFSINNGTSWVADNNVCPSTYNVTGFTYGNGRFVASCKPNGTCDHFS